MSRRVMCVASPAAEPTVAIPIDVQQLGIWAVCQAEPLLDLLLRESDSGDPDVRKSVLVRLRQLASVTGAALGWVGGSVEAVNELYRVVHGLPRVGS